MHTAHDEHERRCKCDRFAKHLTSGAPPRQFCLKQVSGPDCSAGLEPYHSPSLLPKRPLFFSPTRSPALSSLPFPSLPLEAPSSQRSRSGLLALFKPVHVRKPKHKQHPHHLIRPLSPTPTLFPPPLSSHAQAAPTHFF